MKLFSVNKPRKQRMYIYKKIFSFLLFIVISLASTSQKLPPKPVPAKLVNDFTNTLTSDQRQSIEKKLVAFDDSTSTQIAVVIIPSLDGYDVAEYNVALGRAWGVGGKEFSNGVILLIAKNDRKINIATGYGVEGALPDITAKHIIDDVIKPNFKGEDYYRGIDEGTDAIIKAVQGEYNTPRQKKSTGTGSGKFIFIIIIIIFLLLVSGGGGGKGGFLSRRGYRGIIGPMILGELLGGGGRRGGGWSGGGGSSGGGGFGGFGGGGFGGGGASGSW